MSATAERGHDDVVRLRVASGGDVHFVDTWGYTPLLGAVQGGHPQTVKLLISLGAEVNSGRDGTSSLVSAPMEDGRTDIAAILVAAGARTEADAPDPKPPLR